MHCFNLTVRYALLPKLGALYPECVRYHLHWAEKGVLGTWDLGSRRYWIFSSCFAVGSYGICILFVAAHICFRTDGGCPRECFAAFKLITVRPRNRQMHKGHSTTDRPKKSRNNTLHLRFGLNFAHKVIVVVDSRGENFSLVRRIDFEIWPRANFHLCSKLQHSSNVFSSWFIELI